MASLYQPVRLANLILSLIYIVLGAIDLANVVQYNFDVLIIVQLSISLAVVFFFGLQGSYRHNRKYMLTFAAIIAVCFILGFFGQIVYYTSQGTGLGLFILAIIQSELLRRDYQLPM